MIVLGSRKSLPNMSARLWWLQLILVMLVGDAIGRKHHLEIQVSRMMIQVPGLQANCSVVEGPVDWILLNHNSSFNCLPINLFTIAICVVIHVWEVFP